MPRRPEAYLLKILADNVRAFRSEKGLSQEALADLCSLHRTYVGSIERMERNATLATLALLAEALGVGVPELLTPREHAKEKKPK
jgi:transcriptional regulator with XRE-family HTH domain